MTESPQNIINRSFKEEQTALLNSFLDIHCLNAWKIPPSKKEKGYLNSLEMMISPVCNTACSYCYIKNYSSLLYPCAYDRKTLLQNCEKVMKWLVKNQYYPSCLEIFSGEFFNLPFWKEYLNIVFSYLKKMPEGTRIPISIPTNATFLFSDGKTEEIQNLLDASKEEGFHIHLSISVDGKYLDNETRPLRNGKAYDDTFYDKLFTFGAKNDYGFHPMIGAKGIEHWIENFEWYIENIQKYYHLENRWRACRYIYLLEVRNPDWKDQELNYLQKFLAYLLQVMFEDCKNSEERELRLNSRDLNILSSITSTVGRGLGCSLQQCFHIRMGDLALVSCHRTSYEELIPCHLEISDDGDLLIKETKNVNSYIFSNSLDFRHLGKCDKCPISSFCSGPCLGCNYEVNRDLYSVVPTVCDLEYTKILGAISALDEIDPGVLNIVDHKISERNGLKKYQLREIRKFLKIEKNKKENTKK